jgi:hypothetical protein
VPRHAEVFVIPKRVLGLLFACCTVVMLWPADAAAQGRAVRRAPAVRTSVVISAGYYRPYYFRPYYYRPYYRPYFGAFYSPFYNPFYTGFYAGYAGFYSGWYPMYAQYPRYPGYYYGRAWATARIEVKPREAQVYIDGYFVGIVDQFDGVFQRLDVPAGEHEVAVYLQGYRTYREKTLFRPGEGYHFKAILEPLAAGAPAELAPKPSSTGPDPYRDPRDPYAPRDPNRPSQDQNPPYPGDQREPRDPGRTVPLPERRGDRAPDSRDFGTLNIRVQPGDAVVIIDGERWDSPEGGSRLIVQLVGGPHRVEVRKDGFKPYTSTIQIRPGETQSLNISLPPGGE